MGFNQPEQEPEPTEKATEAPANTTAADSRAALAEEVTTDWATNGNTDTKKDADSPFLPPPNEYFDPDRPIIEWDWIKSFVNKDKPATADPEAKPADAPQNQPAKPTLPPLDFTPFSPFDAPRTPQATPEGQPAATETKPPVEAPKPGTTPPAEQPAGQTEAKPTDVPPQSQPGTTPPAEQPTGQTEAKPTDVPPQSQPGTTPAAEQPTGQTEAKPADVPPQSQPGASPEAPGSAPPKDTQAPSEVKPEVDANNAPEFFLPEAPGTQPEAQPEAAAEAPQNNGEIEYEQSTPQAGWLESGGSQEKLPEGPMVQPPPEKVKLSQVTFEDSQLAKAVETAKANNLPVIVYTGANFCGYCPAAKAKLSNIASGIGAAAETTAVVVKLTSEEAQKLMGSGDANAALLKQLMGHGTHVPRLAIYNPNDMSSPVGNTTISGWSESQLRGHINSSVESAMGGKKPERQPDRLPEAAPRLHKPNLYSEGSITQAVDFARKNDKPLIGLVTDKMNPKVMEAMQYLNENKLAAAVDVNRGQMEQMYKIGAETRQFQALKSIQKAEKQQGIESSYMTSFAPGDLKNKANMFTPRLAASPQTPEQMVQFFKDSGVQLTKEQEHDLMGILGAKPKPAELPQPPAEQPQPPAEQPQPPAEQPQPPAEKPEPPAEQPQPPAEKPEPPAEQTQPPAEQPAEQQLEKPEAKTNDFKVNKPEDIQAILEKAKESGLPVVVHAPTAMCDDKSCFMDELDKGTPGRFADSAVFVQIPRGGLKLGDNKDPFLTELNKVFAVTDGEHKDQIDMHVFKFDAKADKFVEQPAEAQKPYRVKPFSPIPKRR